MGARPMARLIQDTIRKALADELLFGRLVGGGKVTIDVDADDKVRLVFEENEGSRAGGLKTRRSERVLTSAARATQNGARWRRSALRGPRIRYGV